MSAETLAIVLNHSKARGTAKLVLIGIANHDGDGGAWPSIATLARYAGVNIRATQNAIATLVKLREIVVHRQSGGAAAMPDYLRPNRYDILLVCPEYCDHSKRHRDTRNHLALVPVDNGRSDRVHENAPGARECTPPGARECTPELTLKNLRETSSETLVNDPVDNSTRVEVPRCPQCGREVVARWLAPRFFMICPAAELDHADGRAYAAARAAPPRQPPKPTPRRPVAKMRSQCGHRTGCSS